MVADGQAVAVVGTPDRSRVPSSTIDRVRRVLRKHYWLQWLIPPAFCLILLAQMLFSVRQMSQHADEATHLYGGYRALKCGDFTFGREHPPLAKMLAAIPLLWSNIPIDCSQREVGADEEDQATHWLYSREDWWSSLMKARVVASLAAVALCLGVWFTARRMFGLAVAVVSTMILVFEPNILAHGALLLNNILLSALFLLTVFSFYLWTEHRTEPRSVPLLVSAGVLLGLALLSKHSAVLLIPVLILLAVADACLERNDTRESAGRTLRNLGAVAAIVLIAVATIWCGFGMRYSPTIARASDAITQQPLTGMKSMKSLDGKILVIMRTAHLLPQAYLDGLIDVRGLLTAEANVIDILGRPYSTTPWFFFPVAAAIKFTAPFLAMLAMGGAGLILMGREHRREFVFLLLPAVVFLAVSMGVQRPAIGIWHLFPMVPFLVIAAAAGCVYVAWRYRWAAGVLACLLVLHAVSSLRAYPNYLSYANELWGGPQNLYRRLPWTDLNQTYWQVSRYMEQHPNTPCWLDSDWRVPAGKYSVPCTQMGNHWETELPARMRGIVFVSSSWLQIDGRPGDPLAPFNQSRPKALLGGSAMMVYEGEFDSRAAAGAAFENTTLRLLHSADPKTALLPAAQAVEMAPWSARAHYYHCVALAFSGYPNQEIAECETAIKLAAGDPLLRSDRLMEDAGEIIRGARPTGNRPNP
ncbi:MAG: glycosyltransferase family 39 protein [Terriglobales bacterium]